MDNKIFLGDLKPYNELDDAQRNFLIEHYKRCQAFWMHWTTTIWSVPSVAATINIGAYTLLYGPAKDIDTPYKAVILIVLVLLNIGLTIGACKHSYMQHQFGNRIVDIEKYFNIQKVKLQNFSGSYVYVAVMAIITIINIGLLMCNFICGC